MNYDQYQQLYNAAKEQIADRVAKIQPRAGNGASVNGMGISIEVPMAEEVVGQVNLTLYYILAKVEHKIYTFENRYQVGPNNEVTFAFGLEPEPPLTKLTLQFIASNLGGEYFPFPVQVTLVQYVQLTQEEGYLEEPMRTVTLELTGAPISMDFYYDPTKYRAQIVRLTQLTKI